MDEVRLDPEGKLFFEVGALTDVGCVRMNNEDAYGFFPGIDPTRGSVVLVADGMGGAAAGEVASALAVDTVGRRYFEPEAGASPHEALRSAVESANAVIYERADRDERLMGMGTTCSAIAVCGTQLTYGHVGDSRVYLVEDGRIQMITRDHSLAAEFERKGGAVQAPPRARNVLTRCLGVKADVDVDVPPAPVDIAPGAVVVLCSDGLSNQVEDGEILRIATSYPPDGACARLVQLAKERGAPDNVTVIVARVVSG